MKNFGANVVYHVSKIELKSIKIYAKIDHIEELGTQNHKIDTGMQKIEPGRWKIDTGSRKMENGSDICSPVRG